MLRSALSSCRGAALSDLLALAMPQCQDFLPILGLFHSLAARLRLTRGERGDKALASRFLVP